MPRRLLSFGLRGWCHRVLANQMSEFWAGCWPFAVRFGPIRGRELGRDAGEEISGARLSCGDGYGKLFTADGHWWKSSVVKICSDCNYLWFVPQGGYQPRAVGSVPQAEHLELVLSGAGMGEEFWRWRSVMAFPTSTPGSFGACPVTTLSPIHPQWPEAGWNICLVCPLMASLVNLISLTNTNYSHAPWLSNSGNLTKVCKLETTALLLALFSFLCAQLRARHGS